MRRGARAVSFLSILLAGTVLAGCPKTGGEIEPRVITRPASPTPTPGADPAETKRIGKLFRISMLEAQRPWTPEGFAGWLTDPDPSVRAAAVLGIGRAGEALAGAGGDALPFVDLLLTATKDNSAEVRGAVAAAIGLIGPPASGKLDAPLAAETNAEVRVRWVRAAGRVAPIPRKREGGEAPAAASPEIALLETALADDALAPAAGYALGVWALRCERGGGVAELPAAALDAVQKRFERTAGEEREPFAYALWRLHAPGTGAQLRAGLADPSPRVRGWSARGLGAIPGTHARREVARLLRDSSSDVRVEASRAIAKLEDADQTAAVELVDLLDRSDPPRLTEEAMGAADRHSAVAAMEALGELGERFGFRAIEEPLRARLISDDPYLFGAAVVAYARVAGPAAIGDLVDAASARDPSAAWRHRRAVAEALAHVKPKPAAGAVSPAGNPETPADELSPLVPPAARELVAKLLTDEDFRVRAAALDAYAALVGPDAGPRLAAVLTSSGDVAMLGTAAERLSAIEPAPAYAGPALVGALARLADEDPETAAGLVESAAKRGGDAVLPVLEKAATSPSNALMLAAAKALRAKGRAPPARTAPPSGVPDEAQFLEAADWTRLTIRTNRGEIRVQLFPEIAPITVWQLGTLARRGHFRAGSFHRVVPAFVVQGGDPRGDGWGGPSRAQGFASSIPCELSDLPYTPGTAGMALSGRDTGGSQFFFTTTPQPHLESAYTVFGRILRGGEIVDALGIGAEIVDVSVP